MWYYVIKLYFCHTPPDLPICLPKQKLHPKAKIINVDNIWHSRQNMLSDSVSCGL